MTSSRRHFHNSFRTLTHGLGAAAVIASAAAASPLGTATAEIDRIVAGGPFEPTWESLKNHKDPGWFADAKFGIYTHWGPVTVGAEDGPEGSQWYGKSMYSPASPVFAYHRRKFGDQATVGYKDIIPRFTAEKFDAAAWADLFARSGARFAGPVATHHDNFAMWDSAVTRWNSKTMGPRRDITGELEKEIRARGMKFITTFHHGFAWRYFQDAFKYDGAAPGLVELYTEPHDPADPPSKRFQDQWLAMVHEVLQRYQPDLIWFDFEFHVVIQSAYQRKLFATAYNWAHQNRREIGVCQKSREIDRHTGIIDFERGREDRLVPYLWLTDTTAGPWFNQKSEEFKTTDHLVDVLADIISKNGCLLLNVGPAADGTIPEQARDILLGIGEWLGINGRAVYETRPWGRFGEGPTRQAKAGGFSERADKPFTSADIRFTRSKDGRDLYATVLDWPADGRVLVKSLALAAGPVATVSLLGHDGKLSWSQTRDGLAVDLPAHRPCKHAFVLHVTGNGLKPAPLTQSGPSGTAEPHAGEIVLAASSATIHGSRLRVEERHDIEFLSTWNNPAEWASWTIRAPEKATFEVSVVCATPIPDIEFEVRIGGKTLTGTATRGRDWFDYHTIEIGRVELPPGTPVQASIHARDAAKWRAVNIKEIRLNDVN
jgi:alpha-L-fucosidase